MKTNTLNLDGFGKKLQDMEEHLQNKVVNQMIISILHLFVIYVPVLYSVLNYICSNWLLKSYKGNFIMPKSAMRMKSKYVNINYI